MQMNSYNNLLQEEPKMQELQLQLDGTHEGNCKSLEKHLQQVRETYRYCFIVS